MIRTISKITAVASFLLLHGFFHSCSNVKIVPEAGEPLPVWSEGCLDIHSINSARGECTFYVLPDGTTLLVDAGEFHTSGSKYPMVEQKPDSTVRPYKVYASYIRNVAGVSKIDYALLTHFHMDHMGRIERDYEVSDSGYVLTGMSALYEEIPFACLTDRAYPDYEDSKTMRNWEKFVSVISDRDGVKVRKFELGSENQFGLLYGRDRYPDFNITNYHVNGKVWNDGVVEDCWEGRKLSENGASAGFLLTYGKFDWFAAGDAGDNGRVEKPVARAIGHRIDAMKGHHHMSWNTMSEEMLEIFRPQVVVNQSFYSHQPWPETMEKVLNAGLDEGETRDVFLTNLHDSTYVDRMDLLSEVRDYRGHVVIRVMPGGESFYVSMLDDSTLECKVRKVYGPYICN